MATALITLNQGFTGIPGHAFVGVTGFLVTATNDDNTGVNSWQIDLVDIPIGSTLLTGTLAFNDASSTPTATFTPDVSGSYRLVLTVWDNPGRVGTNDSDIRNFIIPEAKHGFVVPPYQVDPGPKPTLASAAPGAKPNETNIGGDEKGWLGFGGDGLLGELIKSLDASNFDAIPDIGSNAYRSVLGVTGTDGKILPWLGFQVVPDTTGSWIVPVQSGAALYRMNAAGYPIAYYRGTADYFTDKILAFDYAYSIGKVWAVGMNTGTGDGFIQEIIPDPLGHGTINYISVGDAITNIELDPATNRLWAAQANNGDIYKIDPATPGVPIATLSTGSSIGPVRIDPSVNRGFFLDPVVGNISRFTLGATPAIDIGPVAVGGPGVRALAVNAGRVYAGEGQNFGAVDADLASSPVSNTTNLWIAINSLDWEPGFGELWATAENFEGNIVFAKVNSTTLAVEQIVQLSPDGINVGYGIGPPARVRFQYSEAWVYDSGYSSSLVEGNLYKVDRTSGGGQLANDVNGSTTVSPTFTDLGHNFTTEGILPGDYLILFVPDAIIYEVVTVGTTTLTVNRNFPGIASGLTWEIWRPMTKTLLGVPGPKAIGYLDRTSQVFVPRFENDANDAVLGNGILGGVYQKDGDQIHVAIGFEKGTTTLYGTGTFLLPIPPDIALDPTKLLRTTGDRIGMSIMSAYATVLPPGVVGEIAVTPVFTYAPGFSLSTAAPNPGDRLVLKYTLPILLTEDS